MIFPQGLPNPFFQEYWSNRIFASKLTAVSPLPKIGLSGENKLDPAPVPKTVEKLAFTEEGKKKDLSRGIPSVGCCYNKTLAVFTPR
jgi:hypothetical protein